MTKKDLEALRSKHKLARKAAYEDGSFSDFTYEVGYVDALDFVLEHLDELCEEIHEDNLMQRAAKEAEYHIRKYFQDKYGYDNEWSKDEIEDRIQRAIDEGDTETLANSFIGSADDVRPR
jgi:hypothetical protein